MSLKDLFEIGVVVFLMNLMGFSGQVIHAQNEIDNESFVSIGLLVNEKNEAVSRCSAEIAIEEINKQGGINGRPVKLSVRLVEGSWGAGSREVVDLVFKDKVMAILGAIDGQDSHLAEQVIAKTQVLYISSWASDPSLSKAYVPWFFSLVPTDDQQAFTLLEELTVSNDFDDIFVVYDDSYDAQQAYKSLNNASKSFKNSRLSALSYKSLGSTDLLTRIQHEPTDAIILIGSNLPVSKIRHQIENSTLNIPLYSHLSTQAALDFSQEETRMGNQWKPMFSPNVLRSDYVRYGKSFNSSCHQEPGAMSVFVYDGIMIISKALARAQHHSLSLHKSMLEIKYQGLTGSIEFDSLGRRENIGKLPVIRE